MNKSIIALAVAGLLTSGIANSAGNITVSTNAPIFSIATIATEKTDVVRATTGGPAPLTFTIASGGPGNSTISDEDNLTLELSGGAKFDSATLDTELVSTGFIDDAAVTIAPSTCTLSDGDTKVSCPLDGNGTPNTVTTFTLTNTAYDLSGVTEAGAIEMKATVSTTTPGGLVGSPAIVTENFVTDPLANVFTASVGIVTPGALIADDDTTALVSESFFKFGTGAGDVKTPNTGSAAKTAVVTAPVDLDGADFSDATGQYLIKLSGLPTGTKQVTVTEVLGGGISASNATGGAETATGTGQFFLDGAGNGYAVTPTDDNVSYTDLVIEVTGTDPVSATEAKIEIVYLAGAADLFVDHVILEESIFVTIKRDGASFTTNSVGPALKIKITDMSGSLVSGTGGISLIAYDAAGAMISGSMTIPDLESNSMVKITGTDLEAAYPGVKRVDVSVASSDITASAQKVNADGGINVNTLHINGSGNANGAI